MRPRKPAIARLSALFCLVILVGGCVGEPNLDPVVDEPSRLVFLIRFDEPFVSVPAEQWPDFSIHLSEQDAVLLGSEREYPFVWNGNGAASAQVDILASNYWRASMEQGIKLPCLQDPVTIRSTTSEDVVVVREAAFCPGFARVVHRIEPEPVLSLLGP